MNDVSRHDNCALKGNNEFLRKRLRARPHEYLRSRMDLADVVSSERTIHGFSPQSLAERAGVDRRVITSIERAHPVSSIGDIRKVLRAIDVDPTALPSLSPVGALEQMERCQQWSAHTGLPLERISSGLASVPLIIAGTGGDAHQFASVNPAFLWHPLFWLPDQVAFRQRWNNPAGGDLITEDLNIWHARVALQLNYSGLYNPELGWLDVLSVYGLDITTPEVVAQVAAWLAGGEDEILDGIDLTTVILDALSMDDAVTTAASIAPELKVIQWGIQSDSLVQLLDEVREDPSTTNSDLRAATVNAAYLGAASFSDLPWEGTASEHETQWSKWADDAATGQFASPADFIEQNFTPIYKRLRQIRDRFWPAVLSSVRDAMAEVSGQ